LGCYQSGYQSNVRKSSAEVGSPRDFLAGARLANATATVTPTYAGTSWMRCGTIHRRIEPGKRPSERVPEATRMQYCARWRLHWNMTGGRKTARRARPGRQLASRAGRGEASSAAPAELQSYKLRLRRGHRRHSGSSHLSAEPSADRTGKVPRVRADGKRQQSQRARPITVGVEKRQKQSPLVLDRDRVNRELRAHPICVG
jgi:hypothetical protein